MNHCSDDDPKDTVMSDTGSDDFRVLSISKGGVENTVNHANVQTSKPENKTPGDRSRQQESSCEAAGVSNAQDAESADISTGGISSKSLDEWVQSAVAIQRSGNSFTDMVRKNKNFRNPAIFEKMISYCDIDEFGTELPQDPPLHEHEYYEAIADFQEECMRETL